MTSAIEDDGILARLLITAPAHYGWAAVGSGAIMDGSAMFIVYPDDTGCGMKSFTSSKTEH